MTAWHRRAMLTFALCWQALLTCSVHGDGPVRFGFPLPEIQLGRGLAIEGQGGPRLQWRRLQARPDPVTGCTWVELAIVSGRGTLRVVAGGVQECRSRRGPVLERVTELADQDGVRSETEVVRFCDGTSDRRVRKTWCSDTRLEDGETMLAGESHTDADPGWDERWLRVEIARSAWERAGVLPRDQGLSRSVRAELARLAAILPEAKGRRGTGDYLRSGDVFTNQEFDTTLGMARLGLACESQALLRKALRGARHLADIDLDSASGLPFRHGKDHRSAAPEPGHAWLSGLLLVGCLAADDALIGSARTIAHGLARRRTALTGRDEKARDFGWPLQELETWLRFAADKEVATAAANLVVELARRFDPGIGALRFGEGERRQGFYEERCWITGGVVLPGLWMAQKRCPDRALLALATALAGGLVRVCGNGREGLPVRALLRAGATISELRLSNVPELALLLEGVPAETLPGLLHRRGVANAIGGMLREDDPDLATSWSMVARCTWVLR